MKQLFILVMLSMSIISSAIAVGSSIAVRETTQNSPLINIFCVEKDKIKFTDKHSFRFSNLIGYKTKQNAKNQENGIFIGLTLNFSFGPMDENEETYYFIKEEYIKHSWWISRGMVFQLKATIKPFGSVFNFKDLDAFTKKSEFQCFFTILACNLKEKATKLIEKCDTIVHREMSWLVAYHKLSLSIELLDYLLKIENYSNADKVALYIVDQLIDECFWSEIMKIDASLYDDKHAAEYYAEESGANICFVDYKQFHIVYSCLNFDNLIGYKTKQDAEQSKNGFTVGILCDWRYRRFYYYFILPELNGQDIWIINEYGSAQDISKICHSLEAVENTWNEFKTKTSEQKAEYLDKLTSKYRDILITKAYSNGPLDDMYKLEFIENTADILKNTFAEAYANVHKIALYCAKNQAETLKKIYESAPKIAQN